MLGFRLWYQNKCKWGCL